MTNRWRNSDRLYFGGASADGDCSRGIKRHLLLGRKVTTNRDSILESRDITLPTKVHLVKAHVWMWELDYEEGWAPRNWCIWTVVLEKTLESPLDCKESNQSILKEINRGISLEGLMLKLKLQYFGHVMWRVDSLEKTHAGRDWGQEEKGTEDEMAGWHHWLYGREFGWTPGVGDRQGGLACCNSWGHKESDTTERLNWTELNITVLEWVMTIRKMFIK